MSLNKRLINTGAGFTPEFAAASTTSFGMSGDQNFATKTITLTLDYLDPATSTYINYYTEQWTNSNANLTITPSAGAFLFATNTKTRRTIKFTGSMYFGAYFTPNQITRAGSYVFSNVTLTRLDSGDSFYPSITSTSLSGAGINYSDNGGNYNLIGAEMIFDYNL